MTTMMRARKRVGLGLAVSLLAAAATGCGGGDATVTGAGAPLPQGGEPVELDPGDFTTVIDNRWLPLTPGGRWIYRETDPRGGTQRVVVRVRGRTRTVANGVEARVVSDVASEGGEPIEVTDDWYAQDRSGNVWYLGERTAEYRNGEVTSRAGSWEAGRDGAEAGIVMPADPRPGMRYRQEYYRGEAEDSAAVVGRGDDRAGVPYGYFDEDVVMTRETTPLEPRIEELKLYAPGIGEVLSLHSDRSRGSSELVSYRPGG
jgi:hypothetical protein